jgi:hypothetical protein
MGDSATVIDRMGSARRCDHTIEHLPCAMHPDVVLALKQAARIGTI